MREEIKLFLSIESIVSIIIYGDGTRYLNDFSRATQQNTEI